jgi:hypothetical protein
VTPSSYASVERFFWRKSKHGVPGANYNPDGSDRAFDDLDAFVNTGAEVNQRYVKTLGHSVGTKHMQDRVGEAGAQMESSGREEGARTDRDVQDAGRARRTQTGDDGHSDETARLPIVQTDVHETVGQADRHETVGSGRWT